MKFKRFVVFISLLIFLSPCFGQNNTSDSDYLIGVCKKSIGLDKKTSFSRLAKSENPQFTSVNEEFSDKCNVENGVFLPTLITIHTDYGNIKLLLFDDTPLHKENFIHLVKAGVYNHIIFHRVIDDFMIQSGDYSTRNKPVSYDPSIIKSTIPAEIKPHHKHIRGAIGAARYGGEQNPEKRSSGTQFYIIQNCNGAHHLDGEYTVFGQVMSGFEVIDEIAAQPTNEKNRPVNEIRITIDAEKVNKADVEKFYNFTY